MKHMLVSPDTGWLCSRLGKRITFSSRAIAEKANARFGGYFAPEPVPDTQIFAQVFNDRGEVLDTYHAEASPQAALAAIRGKYPHAVRVLMDVALTPHP